MIDRYWQPRCHDEADWKLVTRPNDKIFITCEKCGKQTGKVDAWAGNYAEIFSTDTCNCGRGNVALQSKCCPSNFDIVGEGEKIFLACNECEEIIENVEVSMHG